MRTMINAMLAALPFRAEVRHLKTGGLYEEVGTCILEAGWEPAVLYRNDKGELIARAAAEFDDGRFVRAGEQSSQEAVARIIDPDAWHAALPEDGGSAHWHARRRAARDKAAVAIALMAARWGSAA